MAAPLVAEAQALVQQPVDVYRPATAPPAEQVAQFEQALGRAQQEQAAFGVPPSNNDVYMRPELLPPIASASDSVFNRLGGAAESMSRGFRSSIDEGIAKLSYLDFSDPGALVTVMEVQLGVFSAATHVQFAAKVADLSVHGLTTLFRNQG